MYKVIKRTGDLVDFDQSKITDAIAKAFHELIYPNATTKQMSAELSAEVKDTLMRLPEDSVTIQNIQEAVYDALIRSDYPDVARTYIAYSEAQNAQRRLNETLKKPIVRVRKKSGRLEPWNKTKLEVAIQSATTKPLDSVLMEVITSKIHDKVMNLETNVVTTNQLHDFVEETLGEIAPEVFEQYAIYRRYKREMSKSYDKARQESNKILHDGDKENANKDSQLNSTKQALIAESYMTQLMRDFELSPEIRNAHDEGFVYIHDLGARYLRQTNCCLFDMGAVLKGGFLMNGAKYIEPKTIATALAIVGDVTLQASAQQYGGFTIPELDSILAPYAVHSFERHQETLADISDDQNKIHEMATKLTIREIEQGIQGFETKLNTVSSSLGQIPFVTITFGMNTSFWGREIAKAILKNRIRGIGADKTTAIFPKLVMLMRSDVNRNEDAPNRDIYDLAVECSSKRLYPDYLSLDGADKGNNLAEVYERSGKVVSGMGCRAYLSPWYNNDEEIYLGRGNMGAVTLNLPKIALESDHDMDKFYELIDHYTKLIWKFHKNYRDKVGKQKGSTNPLFYCEGGAWKTVGYDDPIAPVLEAFTSSLGYIGLEETVQALTGDSLLHNQDLALEIVAYLKKNMEQAEIDYGMQTALYSTPAEGYCYKAQNSNRHQYGEIEGVTDREYLTNSFHVPVWEDITVPEKIAFEEPFHRLATGGRISYNEFPYLTDTDILQESIDFAMDEGLYYGVNIVSSSCFTCNYAGDFRDACPKCGSGDIQTVSRVCGYLSFEKAKGDREGRYNKGKKAEVLDRVLHSYKSKKALENQ